MIVCLYSMLIYETTITDLNGTMVDSKCIILEWKKFGGVKCVSTRSGSQCQACGGDTAAV